jgi:hypothetical protein
MTQENYELVCVWLEVAMKASFNSNGSSSVEVATVSGVESRVCGNGANRFAPNKCMGRAHQG